MIVDEAHHLTWSPEAPSKAYDLIKHLTTQSTGVLLLTATPEQGGIEGHFARLHLLDPARFHSLDAFQAEDNQYSQIRSIVKTLLETPKNETVQLNKEDIALLIETIGDTVTGTFETYDQRLIAIESILDIHGPGREVFRNTRKSTAGFPRRLTHTYPLALPSEYQNLNGTASLTPEYHCNKQEWPHFDTRIEWLVGWLKQNKQTKCLLICHENNTAIEIDKYLNLRAGIRSTAFYEGLSIIERDRAAAYFSDEECGAQILVCSEIGSEGRNFQFLQDLILFDLPMNPDLLEQRIGRLDRIGQKDTINIHVPYFEHSAQSILLDWYHKGLQQFDHSFSAGYIVFQSFSSRLEDAFDRPEDKALIDNLIKDTMAAKQELSQHRESGRDALLELNSCRTHIATSLIEQIRTEESDQNIQDYLCLAFDRYGVNYETHSDDTLILSAGDDLRIDHFPGLDPDGMTVTFNRERALTREDFQFLTWEHPLVSGVMEMVLTSEFGNACVATLPIKKLPAGSLFLEVWYSVTCSAPKALQIDQYLPITPTRFLIDATGKDLTKALAYDKLNAICQPIKKDIARTIIQRARSTIEFMLQVAHEMMESRLPDYKASASKKAESYLNKELYRLQSLSKVNKSIRPENIEYIERKKTTCLNAIEHAQLNLQGLKLMMTTD